MRIFLWGILLLLFSVLPVTHGIASVPDSIGNVLTLQQAIDIGIENNLTVNQAGIQMQTSRINLEQAWGNTLPAINATANQTVGFGRTLNTYDYTYTNQVNSGNYGINGYINLFSGGQVQNTIRQNKYAYAASKMDLQQQKDNLTLNILLAYLQIISGKELLTIAWKQASIDSVQLSRLKNLNEEGALLLLSNLTDLTGKYADDKVNIAIAVNSLESAKINLFKLLNITYKRNIEFEYTIPPISSFDKKINPDNIYQFALHTIPSVLSADLKVQSCKKALMAAKGQYYPTLSFFGSLATNYNSLAYTKVATTTSTEQPTPYYFFQGGRQVDIITTKQNYENQKLSFANQLDDNKATSIGIQLNIPLLNSLHARNNIRQARLNLSNAQLDEKTAQLALQQQIEQATQNSLTAFDQYKSYIEEAAAYSESFRITEIRFNEGIINSDVYVLAKNNLDKANINLVIAKYNYIFRIKVIDYYQGQLEL